MAGGPINGSGAYGKGVDPVGAIIVPTMVQTSIDMVSSFDNLTCLYNKFWYPRNDKMTLPICMFYVKSISETQQVDVSDKRILLYEPQAKVSMAQLGDQIRRGVQEVVVDNSVIKPKSYNLEIILPFQPYSKQFGRSVGEFSQLTSALIDIFAGKAENRGEIDAMNLAYQPVGKIVDIATMFADNPGAKHINKNSLEAMLESQKVLTMKMWSGHDYRYVQIVGLDIKKEGKEDDVFRATLQVRERPVLTMTVAENIGSPSAVKLGWASAAVMGYMKTFTALMANLTGVEEASNAKIAGSDETSVPFLRRS